MKIFITGGTGFIGTHLVRCLAQTDHQLVCLARETSDVTTLEGLGVTVVRGDVTDKASLLRAMAGCDWVANLANLFVLWVLDEQAYTDVNVDGTRNVIESALEVGVTKVVHVSTAAVWGKIDRADWPITEETPPGEQRASKYAQTKYDGDLIAWRLYHERGLPLVMIYPAAVVGPDDPKATGRYIRNVAQGRMSAQVLIDAPFCFVHVRDVCQAIVGALEKEGNLGEKYLVSSANLTFGEINRLASDIAGVRLPAISLPDALTAFNAWCLTRLSKLTKRSPWLDLSVDQVALMRQGFAVDGSKAERELGFHYTPIRQALEEAIGAL